MGGHGGEQRTDDKEGMGGGGRRQLREVGRRGLKYYPIQ